VCWFFGLAGVIDVLLQPRRAFKAEGHAKLLWFVIEAMGVVLVGIFTWAAYALFIRPSVVRAGGRPPRKFTGLSLLHPRQRRLFLHLSPNLRLVQLPGSRQRLKRSCRDDTNGDLTAAEWRERRSELDSEADAAYAEVERLQKQIRAHEADSALDEAEAEAEVAALLESTPRSIRGEVKDTAGVPTVSAMLLRLFDLRPLRLSRRHPRESQRRAQQKARLASGAARPQGEPVLRHRPTRCVALSALELVGGDHGGEC